MYVTVYLPILKECLLIFIIYFHSIILKIYLVLYKITELFMAVHYY